MAIISSSIATKFSHGLVERRRENHPSEHFGSLFFFFCSDFIHSSTRKLALSPTQALTVCSVSKPKLNHCLYPSSSSSSSSSTMEEEHVTSSDEEEKYGRELDIAIRAVQMACALCRNLQHTLNSTSTNYLRANSEEDISPLTIAGYSVQATVSWVLSQSLGSRSSVSILTEEDAAMDMDRHLSESLVKTVNECLGQAPRFGLKGPETALGTPEVLQALRRCTSSPTPSGTFWALVPVDGTLGFLQGDQYAVSLALIEEGEVVVGVLGCPNYPMKKEWLSYQQGYRSILARLSSASAHASENGWDDKGCVVYAKKGGGKAWVQPLLHGNKKMKSARAARVNSSIDDLESATFCVPVENANWCHSFTAGLAHSLGLRKQPICLNSMVRYAAIANGDAEVLMKFGRGGGQKERLWDHAAGVIIIQESGGVVTDTGGSPLNFSKAAHLEEVDRGIIASAGQKLHDKVITAVDASWFSSCL
ncbi:PAP-specific phosphatase HAL2-like [Malania oleifera]|uniref:PAP-specific phosphatase HAL2-like n=1 Tax=Malania oleifera TaxID=397392 RepID=UPI0025ADAFDB|nr:PAP-specific phosphatase HAL2-like [Malania oleifera]